VSVYIYSIYYVRKHVIYARRVYISLRRVDRTRENLLTTPHSTYYYNICILHVVNIYQHYLSPDKTQLRVIFKYLTVYIELARSLK